MKRLNQAGSHIVALAVGLLVVGLVAFAGYTVMQKQTDKTATTIDTSTGTDSTGELSNDVETLDESSSQLDSSLDDTALDADLNDML